MKLLNIFLLIFTYETARAFDSEELRCLVCKKAMQEMDEAVAEIDPGKIVEIGGYSLDSTGTSKVKTVLKKQSEIHLSEMLDDICEKMDKYVRATWKSTGQLTLLELMTPGGGMNPDMSRVDIIQDGDLNKSLAYYCQGIVDDNEDAIIAHYKNGLDKAEERICIEAANLCAPETEDSQKAFEDEL